MHMDYLVKEGKLGEGFIVEKYPDGAVRAAWIDTPKRNLLQANVALDTVNDCLHVASQRS